MPLLIKYILREYLKILALCLITLALVYFVIDFFGKIERLLRFDPPYSMILAYFGLRAPRILFDILPIGILLSTLITLGFFSRHSEIIAMKSAGISLATITMPFLAISLIISFTMALSNLSILPLAKQKAEYVQAVKIKKRSAEGYYGQSSLWLRDGRRTFLNIGHVDPINNLLYDVALIQLSEDFSLRERISAKKIRYEDQTWVMYQGRIHRFAPDGSMVEENFERKNIALQRSPKEFKGLEVNTSKMKFSELYQYINRLEQDGYNTNSYRTDLYDKVSLPLSSFIMALIAIPFGLMETRSRGISRGIGISLLIGGSYWLVHSVSLSLGHAGAIPALLAAGMSNLLFLSVGVFLYLGVRQ